MAKDAAGSPKSGLSGSKPAKPEASETTPSPAAPHFHGHRDRLRDRFRQSGADALADYELLELVLFRILPRRDVKPVAKSLLAHFGTLSEILAAPAARLAAFNGLGPAAALELKAIEALILRAAKGNLIQRPVISGWSALLGYVRLALAAAPREQFRVLFLDRKNQLIADEILGEGTVDQAPVYPREVLRRALELSASALILVHNHPSGDPKPSREDIEVTRQIAAAAKVHEIAIHDHLVVGREGVASFKSLGLL